MAAISLEGACYCSRLGPKAMEACSFAVPDPATLRQLAPAEGARRVPLLEKLPEDVRAEVAERATQQRFRGGEILVEEGSPPKDLLIVRSGSCRVLRERGGLWRQSLTDVSPGYPLNLLPVLTADPHPHRIVGRRAGTLLRLPGESLREALRFHPEQTTALLHCAAKQLRSLLDLAVDLSLYDLEERLVRYLLRHAPDAGDEDAPPWTLSHGDLGQILGATREEVTRRLGRLKRRGLVEVGFRKVAVLDREGLERLRPHSEPSLQV